MMVTEQVTNKLQKLPVAVQEEVLDFIEFLLQKTARATGEDKKPSILFEQAGHNLNDKQLTPEQKAEAIEQWAKSKSLKTPVILDDRREIIYED